MATVSDKEERALLAIAVLVGALAVATLPLVFALGERALGLAFSIPLTLAAVGRLRRQRALELGGGIGALVLLLLALLLGSQPLAIAVMALGALAVVFGVGGFLTQLDVTAGRIWLVACAVALVFGVGLPLLAGVSGGLVALPVLAIGAVAALSRARRAP